MTQDFAAVAATFADHRARSDALIAQARAWTGGQAVDDLGNFDTTPPLDGGQLTNVYARLIALSVQRLRVLSDQLNRAFAENQLAAFVREKLIYDPASQEVVTAGEEITALAALEAKERDRLEGLILSAIRLQMEYRSQQAVTRHGQRMAALAQALCEEAGLDWADEATRRLAGRAILRAEATRAPVPAP